MFYCIIIIFTTDTTSTDQSPTTDALTNVGRCFYTKYTI